MDCTNGPAVKVIRMTKFALLSVSTQFMRDLLLYMMMKVTRTAANAPKMCFSDIRSPHEEDHFVSTAV